MHRTGWILLIALVAPPLCAQEAALIGVARDSSTGQPLPDVIISIPESQLSARSGPDGFFRLEGVTSGPHTIFIRKAGYEPWAFRVALDVQDAQDISIGVVEMAWAHEAVFFGTVVDSSTGNPVSGAVVRITNKIHRAVTDEDGFFEMPGIKSGTHEVTVRHIGYGSWAREVALSIPQPMRVDFGEVPLAPAGAVTLEGITVEGEANEASMIMTEFFTRRRTEQGTFLTYEDIAQLNPRKTSDIFRSMPGMNAHRNGVISSGRGSGGLRGFDPCTVQYYLDGVKVTATTIDVIQPNAIAGIEVYRGAATTPQIFRSQSNANCGVIVIWTRDGRPNR